MKTQEEYNSMTEEQLWHEMQCGDKYELRKIHKALRKYKDGVPIWYRYPNFPTYFSLVVLVLVALGWVVELLT